MKGPVVEMHISIEPKRQSMILNTSPSIGPWKANAFTSYLESSFK